jgi:glutamyl-tRNA synthetase
VLDSALSALKALDSWTLESLEQVLAHSAGRRFGISPRLAFGPVRVAISGRRVSPPLFESLEILGKDSSLVRLEKLRASL